MYARIVFGVLALAAGVTSQSSQPPCVASCIQTDPVSSQCNGDETGAALAQCTCDSLRGSLLIQCIKRCSVDDQDAYAENLPASCAESLFPGQVSGGSSAAGTGTVSGTTTGSGNGAQTSAGATQTTSQTAGTTTTQSTSSTHNAAAQTMVPNMLAGGIAAAMIFL